jgi:hypothetical protein
LRDAFSVSYLANVPADHGRLNAGGFSHEKDCTVR